MYLQLVGFIASKIDWCPHSCDYSLTLSGGRGQSLSTFKLNMSERELALLKSALDGAVAAKSKYYEDAVTTAQRTLDELKNPTDTDELEEMDDA